jgi:hypothetical protein
MRDDDFPDESESFCDAEAFSGSLHHLATTWIDALLRHRAEHAPGLEDYTLIPLLEVVRKPYEEFLSDREMEELWDHLYWMYHECRKESEPALTFRACKAQVRHWLLGPRKLAPRLSKGRRPKKGDGPREGRRRWALSDVRGLCREPCP